MLTLAHLVRRSWSVSLQDNKDNCVLACIYCHYIFDNDKGRGLRNMNRARERIKALDPQYYQITYGDDSDL